MRQGQIGPVVESGGRPVRRSRSVSFLAASRQAKVPQEQADRAGSYQRELDSLSPRPPGIDLKLTHNDRPLYHRPADMDLAGAIDLFFGSEVAKGLLRSKERERGSTFLALSVTLTFTARPAVPVSLRQWPIYSDRSLGHAIQEAYRGLILSGRYPISFLFLTVPPEQVDVNVHPTKIEVRFEEPRRLFSLILSTLRERFLRADLSARWSATPRPALALADKTRSELNAEFSLGTSPIEAQPSLWSPSNRQSTKRSIRWPAASPSIARATLPSCARVTLLLPSLLRQCRRPMIDPKRTTRLLGIPPRQPLLPSTPAPPSRLRVWPIASVDIIAHRSTAGRPGRTGSGDSASQFVPGGRD